MIKAMVSNASQAKHQLSKRLTLRGWQSNAIHQKLIYSSLA